MTKQCILRFSITSNFIDEVDLDVIPLDIYDIILGTPYLFDMKDIFFREHNMYHLFKDGIKYVARSHKMKPICLWFLWKMKMLVTASKDLTLMMITYCDLGDDLFNMDIDYNHMFRDAQHVHHEWLQHEIILDIDLQPLVDRKSDPLFITTSVKKDEFFMGSFYLAFACSILCLFLMLFSYVWIVASTLNAYICKRERMTDIVNIRVVVFISVMIIQVILNQAIWMVDIGQMSPHSLTK